MYARMNSAATALTSDSPLGMGRLPLGTSSSETTVVDLSTRQACIDTSWSTSWFVHDASLAERIQPRTQRRTLRVDASGCGVHYEPAASSPSGSQSGYLPCHH